MTDTMPEPRRSWADNEHTRIRCFQFVEGRHTIPAIIADLESRGAKWEEAELNYSAVWFDDPTPQEIEALQAAVARNDARKEAWERETLIRLAAKYQEDNGG